MYNSLVIPVQIFYKDNGHTALRGSVVGCMDAMVDLFFLLDVIIRFRTSFLDTKKSVEVRDPHIIGKQYLKGSFALDFISSVPFSVFASSDEGSAIGDLLDALGLLKLLRLSRLFTTVQRSNLAQDIKVYLKVVMMAIILLVFIHVLSCIWFSVASSQERWVQNMDFMYGGQSNAYQGFFEGDDAFWRQYFVLLYTGFYIFGVGEIVPRSSEIEFASAFILCSLCTIFNAVIIGYMTSYTEELNRKSVELAEKMNLTNTAMLNLKLSRPLKAQITAYIHQTHTTELLQKELTNFMSQISPIYKRKVTKETFKNLVERNNVLSQLKTAYIAAKIKALGRNVAPARSKLLKLKENDKCITQLVSKLDSIFTGPDDPFLEQEDEAHLVPRRGKEEDEGGNEPDIHEKEESFMYFIRNGKFSVHVKVDHMNVIDQENQPKPVTHLIDGDHFGEIGMLFDTKRTATVRSENYGTLAILKKSHFLELSKTFEQFSTLFKKQIFKYKDPLTTWLFIEMEKIPYFRNLSLLTKQELIYAMERHTYEKNSFICEKDKLADRLYLIQDGIVEVAIKYDRRREEQNFVIERLGRGAIINHRSFMVTDDADTDFVCRTMVSVFSLTTVKLNEIMLKRQDLLSEQSKVA